MPRGGCREWLGFDRQPGLRDGFSVFVLHGTTCAMVISACPQYDLFKKLCILILYRVNLCTSVAATLAGDALFCQELVS